MIPGNHDARNVGYVHFEELIGPRWQTLLIGRRQDRRPRLHRAGPRPRADRPRQVRVPARASSRSPAAFRIFMLHHHLLPMPGTGPRAQHASTTPATCSRCCRSAASTSCSAGHKHVPYAWRLERLFVVNAGTCSSLRLRGNTKACYNLIRIDGRPGAGGAQVPVPRRGDAHRLRAVHGVVRQVHLPRASGGEPIGARPPRAVVLVDGEHYPPVVAAAVARLPRRLRRGGRHLRRRPREAARRRAGRARATRRTGWPRWRPRSACRGSTPWSRGPRPRTRCSRACAPRCARRAPRSSSTSRTSLWSATASASCS